MIEHVHCSYSIYNQMVYLKDNNKIMQETKEQTEQNKAMFKKKLFLFLKFDGKQ